MLALILEFANSHLLFQVLYNRSWGDPFKIDILDGPWSVTYLQQLQNFYKKNNMQHILCSTFLIPWKKTIYHLQKPMKVVSSFKTRNPFWLCITFPIRTWTEPYSTRKSLHLCSIYSKTSFDYVDYWSQRYLPLIIFFFFIFLIGKLHMHQVGFQPTAS